jgi:Domain of unknown function (DUF4340)
MSAKMLGRLALVFAALLLLWGGAAVARHSERLPAGTDAFRLPKITRATVDTVMFAHAADTAVLARKDTSHWTVNGHPAATQAIADLFSAFADTASGSELIAERKTSHASLGVDSAGGTRVVIKGGGKTLADLVAGHRSSDFSGGYVRRADQEATYELRGRLVEWLTRPSDEWRDHRIAGVATDSIAAIEVSRGSRRYTLKHSGTKWELSPGGPADSAAAANLVTGYRTVDASGFATTAETDSARFSPPDRKARLLRKDGTALLTLLFDSTKAGFWVKPDTGATVYKVDSWSGDRLAPADSTLRPHPAKSTAATPAVKKP